jgi:acyl-coenzyme A thioesterase PaaI-like protein
VSSTQQDVTREVLDSVRDFLGGPNPEGDQWRFDFGAHLFSNWGAVYGGAIAAGLLAVARSATPERSPRSLHIQMVRSIPNGSVFASATVRHPGRTVATVEVDLYDERRKLAAIALLTMVAPEAVAAEYDRSIANPPFRSSEVPMVKSLAIREAGIVAALDINGRFIRRGVMPLAENVRPNVDGSSARSLECAVPWNALDVTGPEAACLAADAIVGAPILQSFVPDEVLGPNPDLSLRFTTAPATRVISAAATLLSVQRGTATVGLEVQAENNQLAHGLATSLLLPSS